MKTPQGYRNPVKEKVNPNRSWKTYPSVFHKCDWCNNTQLVLVVKRCSKEIALCNINRTDVYIGADYWTVGRVGDFKAAALTRLLKMTKETMKLNEMESRATQVAEVAKTLEMWKSDDIYMQRRR